MMIHECAVALLRESRWTIKKKLEEERGAGPAIG